LKILEAMQTELSCRAAVAPSEYVFRQRFFYAPGNHVCFFSCGCWVDRCVSFLLHK